MNKFAIHNKLRPNKIFKAHSNSKFTSNSRPSERFQFANKICKSSFIYLQKGDPFNNVDFQRGPQLKQCIKR